MRITVSQLRRIIKEEVAKSSQRSGPTAPNIKIEGDIVYINFNCAVPSDKIKEIQPKFKTAMEQIVSNFCNKELGGNAKIVKKEFYDGLEGSAMYYDFQVKLDQGRIKKEDLKYGIEYVKEMAVDHPSIGWLSM